MKKTLLILSILLFNFFVTAQCNCNILSENFFTGDYSVNQTVAGNYGYAFTIENNGVDPIVTLNASSQNERYFDAIYLPSVGTSTRTFTLSFDNCVATFKPNQETGLGCGSPFLLGPDVGGTYTNFDDTTFTVVYQEDPTGVCGSPGATITLNFTKVNSTNSRVNIPDPNFEQIFINNNEDDIIDGFIDAEAALGVTHLDIIASNISDLTGVEAFINLQTLIASSNFISTVDLSNNCSLQSVFLENNQITSLDLSNNPLLTGLAVTNNNLEYLNIQNGNNTNITVFDTGSNSNLTCVEVDDPIYATNTFTNIDLQTTFNVSCSQDTDALIALYNSTGGANWTNTWDVNASATTFYGVTFDANNRVTSIKLDNNNLTGILPIELGSLTNLTSLELHENQITDGIPTELGNLTNLNTLSLFSNQLTGAIPASLGNLVNVFDLFLARNQLTGPIPASLGYLTVLNRITLNNNLLTGTIPLELANLTNLVTLDLGTNQLTGTIPSTLGTLTNINTLRLTENQLTGSIPPELGNLGSLSLLDLSRNQLTGTIPAGFGNIASLNWFYLYENNLTGTIPAELGNLINLNHLYLRNNQLTGTIPATLENLTNLQHLVLSENQLSGDIPSNSLGVLSNLTVLNLSTNQLTGTISGELGNLYNLSQLSLSNNQLEGAIPGAIANIDGLNTFDVSNNQLTGSLPIGLGNLTNLSQFLVNNNQLSGAIPSGLSLINNLTINIENNNFVFIDFEADFASYQSLTGLTYAPQNNVDVAETINIDPTGAITLTSRFANIDGNTPAAANNLYQWYKDADILVDETNPFIDIVNATSDDAGVYTLKVTNTVVTDLEIDREPITLNVYAVNPNYMLVNDTAIIKGNTENIDLKLVNSQDIRAFQFDVTLPAGFVFNTADLISTARIVDFDVSISELGNNTYRILGFSFTNGIITIGDGAILSLPTLVDASAIAGDYTLDITNVILSDVNNQDVATNPALIGTVTVSDYPLGDSNGNSTVDVLDLLQTIDYILGNNPTPFFFDASDVNMDGVINVLDVVGIQDIILNPGSAQGENQGGIIVSENAVMPMENYLLVTDQNIMQDSSTIVEIELENDDTIRAFQFDINLPAGFTLNTAGIAAVGRLSGFTVSSSDLGGNTFRILAFSFSGGTMAPGTDAILNLPITVDATVAIGDYTLPMTGVVLSDVNNADVASTPLSVGTISITPTLGVNENMFNTNTIKMYPNPASDFINLNINNNYTGALGIRLYDIAGKLIYTKQIEKNENSFNTRINTSQLSNGVYILNVKSKNNSINNRVIINQ